MKITLFYEKSAKKSATLMYSEQKNIIIVLQQNDGPKII